MTKNKFYLLIFKLILVLNLFTQNVNAQNPNQFKYQAVLRDLNGNYIVNQTKTVNINIKQGTPTGTNVFSESQTVSTNAQGLININIGAINTSGLATVNWATGGPFFLSTSVDGIEMGASQLLSVPYAMFSGKAGNGFSGDYNDLTNKPSGSKYGDILFWDGSKWVKVANGVPGDILTLDITGKPIWSKFSLKPATITTVAATNVLPLTATVNGTVIANGSNTTITFQWGTTTAYGKTDAGVPNTVLGNTLTNINANLTGLTANTIYHYRIVATNAGGVSYGADMTFSSLPLIAPTIITKSTNNITATTANLNGTVNANGSISTITFDYGLTISYGSTVNSTPPNADGLLITNASTSISGLAYNTLYHYRIRAINAAGTSYGFDSTFRTSPVKSIAVTKAASSIVGQNVVLNGQVNANNSQTTCFFEYGKTNAYGSTVLAVPSSVTGTSLNSLSASLTGLEYNTIYHFRMVGNNIAGTSYGNDTIFTTPSVKPSVYTKGSNNITSTSATINGTVNANNLATNISFEYGTTNTYGIKTASVPSSTNGSGTINTLLNLSNLQYNTVYHYRVVGENAIGTSLGDDSTFKTLGIAPSITSTDVNQITDKSANLKGVINTYNSATTVTFEYGLTSSYGSQLNVISSSSTYTVALGNLIYGTKYHARIKAKNAFGEVFSSDFTFITKLIDVESNLYNVVSIGDQMWMAENLRTTKFNNLDQISNIWPSTSSAYAWYHIDGTTTTQQQDKETFAPVYGALYNWYVVESTGKKVCPTNWHVPTANEWRTLRTNLISESALKLKETGDVHWNSPNLGTNTSGFSAVGGGYRGCINGLTGGYILKTNSDFWSQDENTSTKGTAFIISNNVVDLSETQSLKEYGFTIRCIKD